MGEVVKAIESVSGLIVEASGMSRQQTQGLREIAVTLEHLDTAMQQNAALVEEETAAAQSLLKHQLQNFKPGGEFETSGHDGHGPQRQFAARAGQALRQAACDAKPGGCTQVQPTARDPCKNLQPQTRRARCGR